MEQLQPNFEINKTRTAIKEGKVELGFNTLVDQFLESIEPDTKGERRMTGRQDPELNAKETAELAIRILTHDKVTDGGVHAIEEHLGDLKWQLRSNIPDTAEDYITKIDNLLEKRSH